MTRDTIADSFLLFVRGPSLLRELEMGDTEAGADAASSSYTASALRSPKCVEVLSNEVASLYNVFGVDGHRRRNLFMIDEHTIMHSTGNYVVFHDIRNNEKSYLMGLDEGGVGCFCVHPSKKCFAVGGIGNQPRIIVYSYPEREIVKVLRGGAERGYSSLDFNQHGTLLASVATSPDYMLTVWDWNEERINLHSKAFGQDVYNVRFSRDDDQRLTTSGIGHIRFWKLASTFTGLKLQGSIGKFGKIELSDIPTFVELPDGKVVSGTEGGDLLLWEGHFVKCRLVRRDGSSCHSSEVTYSELDREEGVLVSASKDGFVRYWDLSTIDMAEVDSDVTMDFPIEPVGEFKPFPEASIIQMVDSGLQLNNKRSYAHLLNTGDLKLLTFSAPSSLDKDADMKLSLQAGILAKNADSYLEKVLVRGHLGEITGLCVAPQAHLAVTCGVDGSVKVWDYLRRSVLSQRQFDEGASVAQWVPADAAGASKGSKRFLVGFASGIMDVFELSSGKAGQTPILTRSMSMRPHKQNITCAEFSVNTLRLATASHDGLLWLFDCSQVAAQEGSESKTATWRPLKFVALDDNQGREKKLVFIKSVQWVKDDTALMCVISDGSLREIDVSAALAPQPEDDSPTFVSPLQPQRVQVQVFIPAVIAPEVSSLDAVSDDEDGNAGEDHEGSSSPGGKGSSDTLSSPVVQAAPGSPSKPPAQAQEARHAPAALNCLLAYSANSLDDQFGVFLGGSLEGRPELMAFTSESVVEGDNAKRISFGKCLMEGETKLAPSVSCLASSTAGGLLLAGTSSGAVCVYAKERVGVFLAVQAHGGAVTAACTSFDDSFLLSVGTDGTLVVTALSSTALTKSADKLSLAIEASAYGGAKLRPAGDKLDAGAASAAHLEFFSDAAALPFADEPASAEAKKSQMGPTYSLPPPPAEGTDVPALTAGSYTIQDAAIKSAEDARAVVALTQREVMQERIKALQAKFESVRAEHAAVPEVAQLLPAELLVDPRIHEGLDAELADRLEELRLLCEYDSVKAERLLAKVRDRLMGGLLMDMIPLSSFKSPTTPTVATVHSFRTLALSTRLRSTLEAVYASVKREAVTIAKAEAIGAAQQAASENAKAISGKVMQKIKAKDHERKGTKGGGVEEGGFSAAVRKEKRQERRRVLEEHMAKRPKDDEDDPRDVAAIKDCQENAGDFKLKCGPDYTVPEDQRVNAEKKKRQLVMLEDSMITLRMQFNERFLSLRNLKKTIVQAVTRDNTRIRQLNAELQDSEPNNGPAVEPALNPTEFPDDRMEVSEEELQAFLKDRENNAWKDVTVAMNTIITGLKMHITIDMNMGTYSVSEVPEQLRTPVPLTEDGLGPQPQGPMANAATKLANMRVYAKGAPASYGKLSRALPALHGCRVEALSPAMADQAPPAAGSLVTRKAAERRKRLIHERQKLQARSAEAFSLFHDAVGLLRENRHTMLSRLKSAENKMLVLLEEFLLLQTFEERDEFLQKKQVKLVREKSELTTEIMDLSSKLDQKRDEVDEWDTKTASLLTEMAELVPENHQFKEFLEKLFKKKRKKRTVANNSDDEGVDSDAEEEDEEEEDEEDEDDDDEDDDGQEICPADLDKLLFEKVLDLREKRHDIEAVNTDAKKLSDDIRRTLDRLKARERQMDKDLSSTEQEVQQFQLQKLASLNQIKVIVSLKAKQIMAFDDSGSLSMPGMMEADIPYSPRHETKMLVAEMPFQDYVVINRQALNDLKERIDVMKGDVVRAREDLRLLHKEKHTLESDRRAGNETIKRLRDNCNEIQNMKFGHSIDIDELERASDNSKEKEVEDRTQTVESAFAKETAALIRKQQALKRKLTECTVRNTELFKEIGKLTETKLLVSRDLGDGHVDVGDRKLAMSKEKEETENIKEYVRMQEREIQSIKMELIMLKRKDNTSLALGI
jgi:WD40 repeat protein